MAERKKSLVSVVLVTLMLMSVFIGTVGAAGTEPGELDVYPTSWNPSIYAGDSKSKEFSVRNKEYLKYAVDYIKVGYEPLEGVKVEKISGPDWLTFATPTDLGDIPMTQSRKFILRASPPEDVEGTFPYKIRVSCTSGEPSYIDITGKITVTPLVTAPTATPTTTPIPTLTPIPTPTPTPALTPSASSTSATPPPETAAEYPTMYFIVLFIMVILLIAVLAGVKYRGRAKKDRGEPIESLSMLETPIPPPSGKEKKPSRKISGHDVFICHSSKDKTVADAMVATLESKGIRCWIAPRDILPGISFQEAIIDAIDSTRIMVLIFSSHSNNSPHIIRELTEAVSKSVIIIPFRIEDVLPSKSMKYLISVPHWLDAYTPPLEQHLEKLAETIQLFLKETKNNNTEDKT